MAKRPDDPTGDDEGTGYCKPPKSGQFKPGQSGNPAGRPKGSKDWAVIFENDLQQLITITENGKPKRLTKQEILAKKLYAKAVEGHFRSAQLIIELTSKVANDQVNPFADLPVAAIAEFLARSLRPEGSSDD